MTTARGSTTTTPGRQGAHPGQFDMIDPGGARPGDLHIGYDESDGPHHYEITQRQRLSRQLRPSLVGQVARADRRPSAVLAARQLRLLWLVELPHQEDRLLPELAAARARRRDRSHARDRDDQLGPPPLRGRGRLGRAVERHALPRLHAGAERPLRPDLLRRLRERGQHLPRARRCGRQQPPAVRAGAADPAARLPLDPVHRGLAQHQQPPDRRSGAQHDHPASARDLHPHQSERRRQRLAVVRRLLDGLAPLRQPPPRHGVLRDRSRPGGRARPD